jgi:hypothetical protein
MEMVMKQLVARWMFALTAAVVLASSPAFGADPAKRKAAQTYSVFKTDGDPVQYDSNDDSAKFDNLLDLSRHLMRMAARMSKYEMPDALPMVSRVSRVELERKVCGEPGPNCKVAALYEASRGIMIAEDLVPETNMFHRSILFHEMVHYLQEMGNEMVHSAACERWYQREVEAYALQNRFLVSVYSPERVSYAGARPTCDKPVETQAHSARDIKSPGLTD